MWPHLPDIRKSHQSRCVCDIIISILVGKFKCLKLPAGMSMEGERILYFHTATNDPRCQMTMCFGQMWYYITFICRSTVEILVHGDSFVCWIRG